MNPLKNNPSYQVCLPQTIRFGEGVANSLSEEIKKIGAARTLIVTDPGIFRSGLIHPIQEQLHKVTKVDIYAEAQPEPSFTGLNNAAKQLKSSHYSVIIGLGGGSSIDTAKGLSVLLAHGGKGENYAGTDKIPGPGIPLIAIPTTAGTGSEVTNIAIFADTDKDLKVGLVSNHLLARLALIDPVLTYGCPKGVTAASGIDALVHGIECYTSLKANDFTDSIAIQAMQLISRNLSAAVNNPTAKKARGAMAEGAMLAGIAFGNSGVAAVHALAYPLGARFHVSHGMANGLLLPYVMKYNAAAVPERYAVVAGILDEKNRNLPPAEAAQKGTEAVTKLVKEIGIPGRLRDIDVPKNALEGMAAATMDVTRLLANNPRPLTLEDVRSIWQDAW
jgi:alcohol dehydrogenase